MVFRISYILDKKLNFLFSIVFFYIKKKEYTFYEKVWNLHFVDIFLVNNFVSCSFLSRIV